MRVIVSHCHEAMRQLRKQGAAYNMYLHDKVMRGGGEPVASLRHEAAWRRKRDYRSVKDIDHRFSVTCQVSKYNTRRPPLWRAGSKCNDQVLFLDFVSCPSAWPRFSDMPQTLKPADPPLLGTEANSYSVSGGPAIGSNIR
jgi:hypothetical protein